MPRSFNSLHPQPSSPSGQQDPPSDEYSDFPPIRVRQSTPDSPIHCDYPQLAILKYSEQCSSPSQQCHPNDFQQRSRPVSDGRGRRIKVRHENYCWRHRVLIEGNFQDIPKRRLEPIDDTNAGPLKDKVTYNFSTSGCTNRRIIARF